MKAENLVALLQFADGLFPSGTYAHSFGIETYTQSGLVNDDATLEEVIRAQLEGSLGPADAVAAVHASRAVRRGDLMSCIELDAQLDAMKPAAEAREASRQMGRQTLRIAVAVVGTAPLREFAEASTKDATPCHQGIVFGMIGGVLGWPDNTVALGFLYSSAAAMVGAALRLLPMGQLAGQQIVARLGPAIVRLSDQAAQRTQLSSSAAGSEIAAMRHERLRARLFRS